MARSRVPLPRRVAPPFAVYRNGVLQTEGSDYRVEDGALVFEADLVKDRISGWRWLIGAVGVGTYRPHDSIDVTYALDGQPKVAEGLDIVRMGD